MVEYKVVIGAKDGKSYQHELKDEKAEALHNKRVGETISGDELGFAGFKFLITGGSDKSGFPMRKGIQAPRKRILIGKSVGFSGKNRNKKKQKGLVIRRTVCGERITKIIRQVNLKVSKEGSGSLGAENDGSLEGSEQAADKEKGG
jgi:small subunit ribosomal protein S6e